MRDLKIIKSKGISIPMVLIVVALILLLLGGVFFFITGITIWGKSLRDQPPNFLVGTGGTLSGCGIPDSYAAIFNQATNNGRILTPSLVAAIFYAGEHGSSWPNINGHWAASYAGAKGPFQFIDSTWLIYGGGGDVMDINDSAKAAAIMLSKNIKSNNSNVEQKLIDRFEEYKPGLFNSNDGSLIKSIKLYNPGSLNVENTGPRKSNAYFYIPRVYEAYVTFQKCTSSPFNITGKCDAGYRNPNMGSDGLMTLPKINSIYSVYGNYPADHRGRFELINLIISISTKWAQLHPNNKLYIGDLNAPGHLSHKTGIDFDLDIPGGMMHNRKTPDPNYNRELALELAKMLISCGNVVAIGYEDPYVKEQIKTLTGQDIIKPWTGHKNHFHVRIKPGTLSITPEVVDDPDDSDGEADEQPVL